MVAAHHSLIGAFVALATGWALVKQARAMLFDGVGVQDGGGWTAVVLAETMVFLVAVGVATA